LQLPGETHIIKPIMVEEFHTRRRFHLSARHLLSAIAAGIILGIWLYYTPPGLLGKADAVGYAVCHRIGERSFFIGERQTPLCARCTGMYLGALTGWIFQQRYGRRGKLPSLKISIILGLFLVGFGIDGVNSYLHFFPNAPSLYQPQNWLRLISGNGMGLGMAALLFPAFNQTIWKDWLDESALHSWKQLGVLLILIAAGALATLSQNPLLLYPLSVLSSLTIVVLLTIIYTMVAVLVTHKDNTFEHWEDLFPYLALGFTVAILQISLMDGGRFLLTHTWDGFNANLLQ
jgi:uncharacterized membrane protein